MSTKALEINNLNYHYKSNWTFAKKLALKNISFEISEGESFGFLGPNGAGKTTTIKCLLGLVRPTSGSIKIFGEDSKISKARNVLGYLPEQPYFYDHLSVQEAMVLYATLAGVAKSDQKNWIAEALSLVGLNDRMKSRMRSLSKGLTQRVAMAQAIVAKPKLLILDEPFSGLDPIGRKEFKDLIFDLKQKGTTIFMSSHILSDVEFLCDRASVLVKGELKGIFNLNEIPQTDSTGFELMLRCKADLQKKFVDICDSMDQQGELLRLIFADRASAMTGLKRALEMNITLDGFSHQHGRLEELFVEIVKNG